MKKQLRGGKICVIYQPSYGAGWYSWHGVKELLFDPTLVEMIERQAHIEEMQEYLQTAYGNIGEDWTGYDLQDLEVAYVSPEERFYIKEYDGSERVIVESEFEWISAS